MQRKCSCGGTPGPGGECEACRKRRESGALQRATNRPTPLSSHSSDVPPIVQDVLRSPGQPLGEDTRAFMEPRFGRDFSRVRVHTNSRAAHSAEMVNALAYTWGQDVVFGAGQYAPRTRKGRRLIAHELAHTIQQASNVGASASGIAHPLDPSEKEAEQASESISGPLFSPLVIRSTRSGIALQRNDAAPAPASPPQSDGSTAACVPAPGIANTDCSAYLQNAWWLPLAYVNNAACACSTTPNVPTARCVRKFLQDRLAATPGGIKALAAANKELEVSLLPGSYYLYQKFVQAVLTPRIYRDHVDAYRSCCCPAGPAPYPAWIGVTSVPIQPCSLVGLTIRYFGSCTGTPGAW